MLVLTKLTLNKIDKRTLSYHKGEEMDQKKIDRINELAKKKKAEGLTPEEKVEQAKLREEYIEGYRRSVRHHI